MMRTILRSWFRDDRGQAMTEYGLIIALVAVVLIGFLVAFRTSLSNRFTQATNSITTGTSPAP